MGGGNIKHFTCPECGKTLELYYTPSRKRCPECAEIAQKKKNRINAANSKKRSSKPAIGNKDNPSTYLGNLIFIKHEQPESDIESNRRYLIQKKQCVKCVEYYHIMEDFNYCHYCLNHGCLRDHGKGPGDCKSFSARKGVNGCKSTERKRPQLAE